MSEKINNKIIFKVENLNFWYNNKAKQALFNINLEIKENKTVALIGPSGCGKSTFLKLLNRIQDENNANVYEGKIWYWKNESQEFVDLKDRKKINNIELRQQVGMVFQQPTVFPVSIYENIAIGLKNIGIFDPKILDQKVEDALKKAALYDEVKDKLKSSAADLSGGQKQRLCIARTIALEPKVILMDEPTSALDPIATQKIENLILSLKNDYTIIIVTHSMSQAQRVTDETIFFLSGEVIEHSSTRQIFTSPLNSKTRDYIMGKIG
ncbi:phosphate ABC transporter ATP-binding protein PstB [Mycoplasmopsis columbina]|uniref:Phosphate import ATP-binding protein pstb n=1 Tax=Mycoplasmopsis columbina SF7 TaxID=1037410 RepID=F9UKA8_9BACT|nr:phosphate ABC transporter ATP-binding protein PstB [Mycoplasmopsis columbina]EGV00113.1 phosphate import ATP-binding protein pstb [Mycoplasmopsis columbina SF7]VEU77010.1 phosphate ABC transporter ATP-binding protein [Mycoplasmopsis columbina]